MQSRNARLGLALFFVYLVLYVGFVLLSAFRPDTMEAEVAGGINLAVLYGFGLIFSAVLLALIYGVACKPEDDADTSEASQ